MDTTAPKQTCDIHAIHQSERTQAQDALIEAAADAAYEVPNCTGFVVIAWDKEAEVVRWAFPEYDENLLKYVTETITTWVTESD